MFLSAIPRKLSLPLAFSCASLASLTVRAEETSSAVPVTGPFYGAKLVCRGHCLVIDPARKTVRSLGYVKGESADIPLTNGILKVHEACERAHRARPDLPGQLYLAQDLARLSVLSDGASSATSSPFLLSSWTGGVEFDFSRYEDFMGIAQFTGIRFVHDGNSLSGVGLAALRLSPVVSVGSACRMESASDRSHHR
jgi:hypothetical protein